MGLRPLSNVAGFPRIGDARELKFATESYWRGAIPEGELLEIARRIRLDNWRFMVDAGVDLVPSNDFSLYDQVLDAICLVGAIPERYGAGNRPVDLDTYFAMARGRQESGVDVTAMEIGSRRRAQHAAAKPLRAQRACGLKKWFDTNYHHIVPELAPTTRFRVASEKPFAEHAEAREELGLDTVPILLGPVSFLLLAKPADGAPADFAPLTLLDDLLDVYAEVVARLARQGATWVQLDEPCFAGDRVDDELAALGRAYTFLARIDERLRICIKTYFDHADGAYQVLRESPVAGLGLDLQHGRPRNLELIRELGSLRDKTLFAGLVDGRNVWINDLDASLDLLDELCAVAGELVVSTSCSLLHCPLDLANEPAGEGSPLDDELRSWMAFARQKVAEVVTLTRGLADGREAIAAELEANRAALESRGLSQRTRNAAVRARVAALSEADARRASPFERRTEAQRRAGLDLPLFPTTTIGSYPQTNEIRRARAAHRAGKIDAAEYERRMRSEIERVIRFQERIGLDVLVHGEPERNDMVQYFAEQMEGYAFTDNGWVQSFGSRYVRPPILYGDVHRPEPMTVDWITYAQSLTDRPVKGMLTGPVTMLQWSFVRDDQPRDETCRQLALAMRDEVADLESAGIRIVQVDEPAIREGLPLRRDRWSAYLDWAIRCFRVTSAVAGDETQIHTHMCYSDFGDILESIQAMDADVLLIEAARSRMELLPDWQRTGYRLQIGPGVYDIHSPRVPATEEMVELLQAAAAVLRPEQLWVNPDCGLKTRSWDEIERALANMVVAARRCRAA